MPIRPVEDPEALRRRAEAILSELGGEVAMDHADAAPGGTGEAEIGALPVYNVPVEGLAGGTLETAMPTAWRYVCLADGASGGEIVDVSPAADGKAVDSSSAVGPFAADLAVVAGRAEEVTADDDLEYSARLLRVPELHVETLWLHAEGRDRFFEISGSDNAEFGLDRLIGAARAYIENLPTEEDEKTFSDGRRGPPGGG